MYFFIFIRDVSSFRNDHKVNAQMSAHFETDYRIVEPATYDQLSAWTQSLSLTQRLEASSLQDDQDDPSEMYRYTMKYCTIAAEQGNLPILKRLFLKRVLWEPEKTLEVVLEKGYLEILKWATSNHNVMEPSIANYRKIIRSAIVSGNVALMEPFLAVTLAAYNARDRADELVRFFGFAMKIGRMDSLLWMWTVYKEELRKSFLLPLIMDAGAGGHVPVMEWAMDLQPPIMDWKKIQYAFGPASEHGHLGLVQWLVLNTPSPFSKTETLVTAMRVLSLHIGRESFHILKWLRSVGAKWPEGMWSTVAKKGVVANEEIMDYLLQEGCPWGVHPYASALSNRDFATLDWLYYHGAGPLKHNGFVANIMIGDEDTFPAVVQWLEDHGCPIDFDDQNLCITATYLGKFETLKWLRAHDPPAFWDERVVLHALASEGHAGRPDIAEWAIAIPRRAFRSPRVCFARTQLFARLRVWMCAVVGGSYLIIVSLHFRGSEQLSRVHRIETSRCIQIRYCLLV